MANWFRNTLNLEYGPIVQKPVDSFTVKTYVPLADPGGGAPWPPLLTLTAADLGYFNALNAKCSQLFFARFYHDVV